MLTVNMLTNNMLTINNISVTYCYVPGIVPNTSHVLTHVKLIGSAWPE